MFDFLTEYTVDNNVFIGNGWKLEFTIEDDILQTIFVILNIQCDIDYFISYQGDAIKYISDALKLLTTSAYHNNFISLLDKCDFATRDWLCKVILINELTVEAEFTLQYTTPNGTRIVFYYNEGISNFHCIYKDETVFTVENNITDIVSLVDHI